MVTIKKVSIDSYIGKTMNRWFGKPERNILGVQLANRRRSGENAKSFVFHTKPVSIFFAPPFLTWKKLAIHEREGQGRLTKELSDALPTLPF